MDKVQIYIDGACSNNQKIEGKDVIGGWGIVFKYRENQKELYGGERDTTNQRMELIACIQALLQLKNKNIPIEIYSDSQYLISCMNDRWYIKWQQNGWRNSQKKPVENKDLWLQLLELISQFDDIKFIKVQGHVGIKLNELADDLAQKGIKDNYISNIKINEK